MVSSALSVADPVHLRMPDRVQPSGWRTRTTEQRHVVEIAFHNWEDAGHPRRPVYLGLRTDKDTKQVLRE